MLRSTVLELRLRVPTWDEDDKDNSAMRVQRSSTTKTIQNGPFMYRYTQYKKKTSHITNITKHDNECHQKFANVPGWCVMYFYFYDCHKALAYLTYLIFFCESVNVHWLDGRAA